MQTRQIGETTYRVGLIKPKIGRKVMMRMVGFIGPALVAGKKSLSEGRGDISMIGAALEAFQKSAKDEDVDFIEDAMASVTKIVNVATMTNGSTQETTTDLVTVFDDHFAGNYGEMFEWLLFALEVNFAGFTKGKNFGMLFSILAKSAEEKMGSTSGSQKEQTGSSTESPPANTTAVPSS